MDNTLSHLLMDWFTRHQRDLPLAQNLQPVSLIIPGYGMALAQAQHKVRDLADALEKRGANIEDRKSVV